MKRILNVCGYNSALSFKLVEEDKLSNLENYIETHHRKVVDEFQEYEDIKPFQFLPGHRSLILGIKAEISDIQSKKKQKVPKSNKMPRDEDEKTLQISLINQLSAYANGISLKLDWSHSIQETEFTQVENSTLVRCKISCPQCGMTSTMRYERSWKVANMYRHLRTHSSTLASTNISKVTSKTSAALSKKKLPNMNKKIEIISVDVVHQNENLNRYNEISEYESDAFIEYASENEIDE